MRANATAIGYPMPGGHQTISVAGTSAAASSVIRANIHRVALYSTTDCHVNFEGAATTSDFFLPAENYVMFPCRPGQTINAIQASASGTLHISEVDSA